MKAFPLLLLVLLTGAQLQAQNCSPDLTPPTAVCPATLFVSLDTNGNLNIPVDVFDEGSFDLCCLGDLKVRRNVDGPCDADNDPDDFSDAILFCCNDIGVNVVVTLRVSDCSGNTNECLTQVIVEDKINPICTPPANVTLTCGNFDPTLAAYGVATATDNCCLNPVTTTVNYAQFDTLCTKGTITRTFKAADCSGNKTQCTQRIVVKHEEDFFIRFPNDLFITNGSTDYGTPQTFGVDCELFATSYSDLVFLNNPDCDTKIERSWFVINWCTYNPNIPVVEIPNPQPVDPPNDPANFPGPVISAHGTPAPWAPTVVSVTPNAPPTDYAVYYPPNVSGYAYKQIIKIVDTAPATVVGKVFVDTLDNCAYDSGEQALANWTVKIRGLATNLMYTATTNSLGEYSKTIGAGDTLVEVSLETPFNYGQNCPSVYLLNTASGQTSTQDIPVHLNANCPLLSIDLASAIMRRCTTNTYTVQACNGSASTVTGVHAEILLDSYLNFSNSSIPATDMGNGLYAFDLGDLDAGECRSFEINFQLDCSAPFGYTHCSEAHIFPYTVCNPSANWTGADLEVSGYCDNDSIRMTITNLGSGNMPNSQNFVVVEDVVMYLNQPFQLNSGQSLQFSAKANGATWRLETPEVPNHPWGGLEAKTVEGCGGLNTAGFVNMFPLNTPDPFESIDCRQNVGSYDPNDKQAFPSGYGAAHFLEANTDIEYHIRFQNTGTDTAFTVVVLDTLSEHLDPLSVRPGVASHGYDFAVLDEHILRFRFDNILLPDSNVNVLGSNGFVKFRVAQKPDNPSGTQIENSAAIYFDFNAPVITNTTLHTIGDHFIVTDVDEAGEQPVQVYPNPAADAVYFKFETALRNARFALRDQLGRDVRNASFEGDTYRFERGSLQAGVYYFNITTSGAQISSGKIALR